MLRAAIKNKGASVRNYIRPDGTNGRAHDEFRVAHGTDTHCLRCKTPYKEVGGGALTFAQVPAK